MHYGVGMRYRKSDGMPVGSLNRRPRNEAEAACYDALLKLGWATVTKRGWPDFICLTPDGRGICVEVKRKAGFKPKQSQKLVLEFLARHGITCYLWTPTGIEKI